MELELKDGTIVKYSESYGYNGVYIVVESKVTDEQKVAIKKQLKEERDLVSLKFS